MPRIILVLLMVVSLNAVVFGATIVVNATDDIFYSGYGTPGTSAGSGNSGQGNFPNFIPLGVGPLSVQFSSVTGTTNYCGGHATCPTGDTGGDGQPNPYNVNGTNLTLANNLSGIVYNGQVFFLIGVFTNGLTPTGTAPATLSYTNSSVLGSSFSPLLNQLFYIGDGQGTSGTQTFVVPSGAKNLYLGFADGTPGFTGSVGAYNDNSGSLTATYAITAAASAVPEPISFSLMGVGLASMALLRKRIWR